MQKRINPRSFIHVPNTDVYITKRQTYYGDSWDESHYALAENGLFMPPPALFFAHLSYLRAARDGGLALYDGEDNSVSISEAEEICGCLHTRRLGGVQVYLDAHFVEGRGHLDLDIETDHRVVIKEGVRMLIGKRSPLEFFVSTEPEPDHKDDVTFDRNVQGLPTKRYHCGSMNCRTGIPNTMRFIGPKVNCIAKYGWYLRRGILFDCSSPRNFTSKQDPEQTERYLGVLACADEARMKACS